MFSSWNYKIRVVKQGRGSCGVLHTTWSDNHRPHAGIVRIPNVAIDQINVLSYRSDIILAIFWRKLELPRVMSRCALESNRSSGGRADRKCPPELAERLLRTTWNSALLLFSILMISSMFRVFNFVNPSTTCFQANSIRYLAMLSPGLFSPVTRLT